MRTVHIFRRYEEGNVEKGESSCGLIVAWNEVTDCIADHAAKTVCRRCVNNQMPDVHKFPDLVENEVP